MPKTIRFHETEGASVLKIEDLLLTELEQELAVLKSSGDARNTRHNDP